MTGYEPLDGQLPTPGKVKPPPAPVGPHAPVINVHPLVIPAPKVTASQVLAFVLFVALLVLGGHDYLAHHSTRPVPPTPAPPAPVGELRVILAYDSAGSMTKDQLSALHSTKVRDWLKAHCAKEGKDQSAWRMWDTSENVDGEPEVWRNAWAAAKPMLGTLPQAVIFHGQKGKAYPIESESGLLDTLAKEGGK